MSNWIPNSFQLPNIFVDEGIKNLSPTACVLYIVIVRKTRGWQKNKDAISLTQFEEITGMSRKTVIRGIDELVSCNFVKEYTSKIRGNSKTYSLNDGVFSTPLDSQVVENLHQTSGEIPPVASGKIPHTKTTNKTTLKNNVVYTEAFEKFWSLYPSCKRKGSKSDAEKTFSKFEKKYEIIIQVLEKFKNDQSFLKNDGEFIPSPSSWLNKKHWENEYWTSTQIEEKPSNEIESQPSTKAITAKPVRKNYLS